MTRKTGNKWFTERCGRCLEAHRNYSGKLDKNNIEYVVCGITHKRMDVDYTRMHSNIAKNVAYPTSWKLELT